VQKLQAKHTKKELKTTLDDRVVTPTQTIVGRILTASVKTKADYFGEMEHKLANMKTLRSMPKRGQDVEVAVDASKYGNQNQWLETEYQVDNRFPISITAKGQVDVWPQQGGQYIVGPAGLQASNNNPWGGRGMIMMGKRIAGPINPQMHAGMLLGKIGENGEPFPIGDRYEGTPEAEGKLYLHIGPSPWNQVMSGSFDVKISRKYD
jgi:hypothetical protein